MDLIRASSLDSGFLRKMGGWNRLNLKHEPLPPNGGSPFGDPPYGNEKDKQEQIRLGIEYYKHVT